MKQVYKIIKTETKVRLSQNELKKFLRVPRSASLQTVAILGQHQTGDVELVYVRHDSRLERTAR